MPECKWAGQDAHAKQAANNAGRKEIVRAGEGTGEEGHEGAHAQAARQERRWGV